MHVLLINVLKLNYLHMYFMLVLLVGYCFLSLARNPAIKSKTYNFDFDMFWCCPKAQNLCFFFYT